MTTSDGRIVWGRGLRQLVAERTGRPAGIPPGKLEALMLSTRSGLMLQGWRRESRRFDADSMAAMITAVSEFVRDAFGDHDPGDDCRPETLSVGRRSLLSVRAGPLIASAALQGASHCASRD